MGIRKVFQKKDPTENELREDLNKLGISTKSANGRQEKFGAFKQYAQEKQGARQGFTPVNPYRSLNESNGNSNPYAQNESSMEGENHGNPYSGGNHGNPYSNRGQSSPYGGASEISSYGSGNMSNSYGSTTQGNTYGAHKSNPYGDNSASTNTRPYATSMSSSASNPYASQTSRYSTRGGQENGAYVPHSNVSRERTRPRDYDEESTLDLNAIPTNQMYTSRKPIRRETDIDTLDLNDDPQEEDLNVDLEYLPQEQEVTSEDEEVEAIRQDIKFVKQESVASTRNTLRMAQEADSSGTNTLGILGSQSERLYNTEQNLLLADTQTKVAEEKVKELKRLNRSIFIPAYGNPFNKKSRLRQQEEKLKTEKAQQKYLRESNRKEMYESEQRIKQGIMQNATSSDTYQKYQGQQNLKAAERYQFENDSEDDEMEKEIASNLDQIGLYAKKLRSSAATMGNEVESQNQRLKKIEENADKLDIDVHMNSARLNNIR